LSATSEIRRATVAGRLRPGQEFSLRQIAGQLGVSFIPVREAVRSLEAEGLLITRRGRSATVTPLNSDVLRSICQLRRWVEPEQAARACALTTPADLDVLEAGVKLAQETRGTARTIDRFDTHRKLLLDLLRPAATSWELRNLQMLWRATERYPRVGFDELDCGTADAPNFGRAQRELIAGYRSQNPETARAATLRHIDWSERVADRGLAAAS
jgi:DNA-binding GntR family transcriptional regulator